MFYMVYYSTYIERTREQIMNTATHYIMKDQNKNTIENIMQFDLTWRQKRSNKSMHFSIIAGLSIVSLLSQIL